MGKKNEFVDFYQVLRVWPTATDDAIKKAYFNLARLFHPDVVDKGGDGTNGDANGDVDFKLINEAYAVLSDTVKRREYDESLKKYGSRDRRSTAKEADRRSAQLAFEQARMAMKRNRYDKAVVLLKSAIKCDGSNAAYHSWYGFALGALSTRLHEARDACKKALEMEFYNADYHANLGYVYHQAGLKSTADENFQEALKWDPDHVLALKYLNGNNKKHNGGFMKGLLGLIGLNPGGAGEKAPH